MSTAIIAYLRVSTARQGQSGLGLEAQKETVGAFARASGGVIVETFVEIESGRKCDRPELAKALARCKLLGATLVVARLDRLARDLVFVATMLRDNISFQACDAPYANRLTLGVLAAVAEDEARRTSERTRVALAAARARGVTLGGFKGRLPTAAEQKAGGAVQRAQARQRALALMPTISSIRATGIYTLGGIARELNRQGIPTTRGRPWKATQVGRVLQRGGM